MDITLVLTHDCNLGCGYCYAGRKFHKVMPGDVARRALELGRNPDVPDPFVGFFGGEPLLAYEQLVEFTGLARQILEAPRFMVTTNGTRFNEERLAFLRANDFFVGLSLDGTREAHDATRPGRGGQSSHADVVAGLRQLRRSGVPFEVIAVIDPDNVRQLAQSAAFIEQLGVGRISLNPNYYAHWDDEALSALRSGMEGVADQVISAYRRGRALRVNAIEGKIRSHFKGGYADDDQCGFGMSAITVAPSGRIYQCERLVGEDKDDRWVIGDVFEGFSPRRGELADSAGNHESDCQSCAVKVHCTSWCACANVAETGDHTRPGGAQCTFESVVNRAAARVAHTLMDEGNRLFLKKFQPRETHHEETPRERLQEGAR